MLRLYAGCLILTGFAFSQSKPNILFIYSDDHGYQAIGAYKSWLGAAAKTPNIDRIAAEGMRFDRALVTNSICGPARAVVQTGKYSHINGYLANEQNSEAASAVTWNAAQQTFPKILRANGYQTALIGKWHLGNTTATEPQGFDYWDIVTDQGTYYGPQMTRGNASGRLSSGAQRDITGRMQPDIVADFSIDWLNQRDKSKPFLLMAQFKATHREWEPGPGYYGAFDTVNIPEPVNLFDDYSYRTSAASQQAMTIRSAMVQNDLKLAANNPSADRSRMTTAQQQSWDAYYNTRKSDFTSKFGANNATTLNASATDSVKIRWKYKMYMRDYLATARQMDDNIGRLLHYLDSTGLAANTVVIYSSDQGFYLGEHGWFDKRWMYEQSLRTPLVVRWPGVVSAGSVNKDIVSNLDFAETFLDIAGLTVPSDMQGRSFKPVLQGNTPSNWRKSFYYQYYEFPTYHNVYPHYGVTTDRYKLMYFHCVDEWEFYDLARDPNEMINQYNIPQNASLITTLKTDLTNLRTQYQVTKDASCAANGATVKVSKPQWTDTLPLVSVLGQPRGTRLTGFMEGISISYHAGDQVVFDVSKTGEKKVTLSIHRFNGVLVADLKPQPDGRFVWNPQGLPPGAYIADIGAAGGKRRLFKLMK